MSIGTALTLSYTFGPLSGQIPLNYLDTNYGQLTTVYNNLIGSANTWPFPQTPVSGAATVSTNSTFSFDPSVHGQNCVVTLTNVIAVTLAAATGKIVAGTGYVLQLKAGDTSARTYAKGASMLASGGAMPFTSGTVTSGSIDMLYLIGVDANTVAITGFAQDVR